jgi:peptide deformylase
MKLVPASEIPTAGETPTDDLIKLLKVCLEMQVLCEKEAGAGLSAVQVGVPWKLFILKNHPGAKDAYSYYINCNYERTTASQPTTSLEGCLSIRSPRGRLRRFEVERFNEINVSGKILVLDKGLSLEPVTLFSVTGFEAIVFQHEIDHQNGILISDIGKEIEI